VKKIRSFLLLLIISPFLWAQEEDEWPGAINTNSDIALADLVEGDPINRSKPKPEEPEAAAEKKKFRAKNRTVELSLMNVRVNTSNTFIAANDFLRSPFEMLQSKEIFREVVSINLNDFLNGFKLDFSAAINPLSLNFNWKDKWGFGMDIANTYATGNVSISGNLLSFNEADEDKFGMGAAVFTDVGIPVFFHYGYFKFKIRPAVYIPVIYTEPNITYTYKPSIHDGNNGMLMEIAYDMYVYSVVDLKEIAGGNMDVLIDNIWNIAKNNTGYDFSLGMEYAWDEWLNLGIDILNIPIPYLAATLNNYMHIKGNAYVDTSYINIGDLVNGEEFPPKGTFHYPEDIIIDYKYSSAGKMIYRPFTVLFYADYLPFDTQFIALNPSLGFSINWLYPQPAAMEGGLNVRFDIANMLVTTLGINYNDRKWKNSIDFTMNLRVLQFDIGLSTQSPDFLQSFRGAGMGVNVGFKFGL